MNSKIIKLFSPALATALITVVILCYQNKVEQSLLANDTPCTHEHVEFYENVRPTLGKNGNIDHYACCKCHKAFYDKELTREIVGADSDRYNSVLITKKPVHEWYEKKDVKDDEIINFSTDVGDVNCLTQTDWSTYPTGIGSGTYYFYTSDSHPSIYLDAESMYWNPTHEINRDIYNNGYSTFKINKSLSSLSKISFDYKYWDTCNDVDKANRHISFYSSSDVTTKYEAKLVGDNSWHTFSYEFSSPISISQLIFDIYHFHGELYISNMHFNLYDLNAGEGYDISVDSSWAKKHVPQFGLANNILDVGTILYPTSESSLKIIRDGKEYNAATIAQPLINKDNANQYSIDVWWLMNKSGLGSIANGDLLIIDGVFNATSGGSSYKVTINKTEIIFVSTDSYTYAHYVNHAGDIISDFDTSTKTTYRWYMTSKQSVNSPLDTEFKPTAASNFKINGVAVADINKPGLYQSDVNRGEICVMDIEQGFASLKTTDAKLEIEGYFVSGDVNSYIYVPLTTFYYDGTSIYRIYNDVDTSDLKIGIWNGNHHFLDNDEALINLANAGIDNVIAVNPIWNSKFSHTMDVANEYGVKFYCDPRSWNSTEGCYNEWDGSKPWYMDNDAVAGLIVYDEPSIQLFPTVANYAAKFDQNIGGDKKMFVNLLCSAVSETSLYGSEEYSTNDRYYEDYAYSYTQFLDADMYGFDSYGLFDNGKIRKSFYCDLDVWSHIAKNDGKEMWYTVATAGHTSGDGLYYKTPTLDEMRWKLNLGLTFGAKNIIHYVFANSSSDYDAIAYNDGTIRNQDLYDVVSQAGNEVRNWDEIYSQYTWQGYFTYKTSSLSSNQMFQNLRFAQNASDFGVNSVSSSDSNLLVGSFTNDAGSYAYMVTNAGYSQYSSYSKMYSYIDNSIFTMNDTNVTLNFDKSYSKAIIIKNGVKTLVNVNGSTLSLDLGQYESSFVIPF